MKKVIGSLMISILIIVSFTGCNVDFRHYDEKEMISTANLLVEEKYGVKIDSKDYSYSVGKQISEDKFVALKNKEAENSEIISVSALSKNKKDKGEVISYGVIYNEKTKEVGEITASIQP